MKYNVKNAKKPHFFIVASAISNTYLQVFSALALRSFASDMPAVLHFRKGFKSSQHPYRAVTSIPDAGSPLSISFTTYAPVESVAGTMVIALSPVFSVGGGAPLKSK
jgi:hypothetical protein